MLRRRGLLAGLAGLFVAPAVITTPGLLMPVSVKAFPTYGPNGGKLTLDMIAEYFNRSIRAYREIEAQFGGNEQSNVDMLFDCRDLTLSLQDFAGRYIHPATTALVNHIERRGGRLAKGASIEMPRTFSGVEAVLANMGGVEVRAIRGYDIGTDSLRLRLDVRHS
jgi:hypothetical protein